MSKRSGSLVALLVSALGCASGGGGGDPATPLPWTPGTYLVEASLGASLSAEEFTGELTIYSGENITLLASSGLCEPQTPSDINQDLANGMRSFNCGQARWEFRPIPGGVRGSVRANILEESREETRCGAGQAPPCYIMRTRTVTRSANLRVSPVR